MTGVRWRPEGFEGKCETCREWWPIAEEFWSFRGLRSCKACVSERIRVREQARYRADPIVRERAAANSRAYRKSIPRAQREADNARARAYYAANREAVAERRRVKRNRMQLEWNAVIMERDEARRAYNREWMRQCRRKAA